MATTKIPKLSKNCKDITGQRFGKLVAKQATSRRKSRSVVWRCQCDCGKEIFVDVGCLCSGNTQSCGCSRGKAKITHGMSKTPIYKIWQDMIRRCENPKRYDYKNYGGRGIKVCECWHSFENFYEDVGDPPEGLTLDRWPDNDGDYRPENWRWATRKEQANNRHSGKTFSY